MTRLHMTLMHVVTMMMAMTIEWNRVHAQLCVLNASLCKPSSMPPCVASYTCNTLSGACEPTFRAAGTRCGNQSECRDAPVCSGATGDCATLGAPTDGKPCSSAPESGPCVKGKQCSNGACVALFASNTTTCGSPAACFSAPLCSGNSDKCLSPAPRTGMTCSAPADACRLPTTCSAAGVCDQSSFAPATVMCRSSVGMCDPPEFCSGTSGSCPRDINNICTTLPLTPSDGGFSTTPFTNTPTPSTSTTTKSTTSTTIFTMTSSTFSSPAVSASTPSNSMLVTNSPTPSTTRSTTTTTTTTTPMPVSGATTESPRTKPPTPANSDSTTVSADSTDSDVASESKADMSFIEKTFAPADGFFQSAGSDVSDGLVDDDQNSKDDNSKFLWLLILPAVIIPTLIIAVIICVVAKKKAMQEAKVAASMQQAIGSGGTTGTMQLNQFAPTLSAMGDNEKLEP